MSSTRATLRPEDLLDHLEWMHRLARALTRGDDAEADDLTGEAVRAALADPPRLEGPVRPWLAGVLRNLARLRARSGARRRRREAAARPADDAAPSPGDLVERVEAQRLVAGLVVGLAEPFRSTVLLRYYEDLSAADVARRLGVPAGTVRWRLKHALDELRPALDRAHGGRRERWQALLLPLPGAKAAGALRPASRGRFPAAERGARIAIPTATVVAAGVCVLLFAIGAVLGIGVARRERRGGAALLAAAKGRPVGAVMRVGPGGASLVTVETPDPAGGVRVEGQVIDSLENPVGGATVGIDTNPPRTVVTRPDGGFVFDALMPRRYGFEATAGDLHAGPVFAHLSRGSEPIVLRTVPGQKVRIEVHASADGRPIGGAQVALRSILSWEGRTDPDGAVVFTGVAAGWLQIHAEADGFAPANTFWTTDGENRVDVRLRRGVPVDGRVVDARGAPIAGATVWASATSEPFPPIDPRLEAVTTGADGRWRIAALGVGTYRFEASHPSQVEGTTEPIAVDGGGPRERVEIRLEDGGTLEGEVRGRDGKPVPSAQVCAAVRAIGGGSSMREAFTDGNGRFRLSGLPRRAFDVLARNDEASSPMAAVDLQEGTAAREVVLVLSVDGTIEGMVVDAAGQPVAEAQVHASLDAPGDSDEWRALQLGATLRLISDAGGHFRFAGLPAGGYRLRAAPPTDADLLSPYDGVPARPGDRDVRIAIAGHGSVTGTVVYDDGGGTPPRFSVSVGSVVRGFPDAAGGAFSLVVPAGRTDVSVAGATFATARVSSVDVAAGGVADVGVVKVKRGRTVSGRVLRPDGTPVPGAEVTAGQTLLGDGRRIQLRTRLPGVLEARSDGDGRFSMTGLERDAVAVVAEADGVGRSRSIALPRGATSAEVDLVLEATGSLGGALSRAGRPLAGNAVTALPRSAPGSRFLVVSGADGRFQFDALAPGAYRVFAWDGEVNGLFSSSASVEAGRAAHVDVDVLVGAVALEIDVGTDQGGTVPEAGVVVQSGAVADAAAASASVEQLMMTAADGPSMAYMFQWRAPPATPLRVNVVPGTYTICALAAPGASAPSLEQPPPRCVVRQLEAAARVSLTVPATWVQP